MSSDLIDSSFDHMLETEIIDTGQGINEDKQKMLFIPFLELKNKGVIFNSKLDNNIGMGLACSGAISNKLRGDICLKQTSKGLTVFGFKIPVQVQSVRMEQPKTWTIENI
mmetsp:Transcript_19825/g.30556  ORF Transcript_19825/g.30556 Transcript_19825/m.30556 type:complete len:110 (-) Transcript_19825:798-1127(-)